MDEFYCKLCGCESDKEVCEARCASWDYEEGRLKWSILLVFTVS